MGIKDPDEVVTKQIRIMTGRQSSPEEGQEGGRRDKSGVEPLK